MLKNIDAFCRSGGSSFKAHNCNGMFIHIFLNIHNQIDIFIHMYKIKLLDRSTKRSGTISSVKPSIFSMEPLSAALDGCDPLTLFAKQETNMNPFSTNNEFVSRVSDTLKNFVVHFIQH